ncbi:acid phosphatase/Vanadium-dependent haloperoxidase [Wilcoxina mikolae CBS 423.85]|nr:acid phosphatase/Vanadium-dependent haloperoxidase [Wilcoxina mikolae CBS 423.85]
MASKSMPGRRFFLRLLLSYLLDWIVVIGTVAFAGSASVWITPNSRPFSVNDITIQFPFQTKPKIPSWLLIVCSIIIPALAIGFLTLTLPSRSQSYRKSFTSLQGWKRRFYCLNTALLGLGMAIAIAMIVTDVLKNLLGRPRPDLLSRCNLNHDEIPKFIVGPGELLDWKVCRSYTTAKGSVSGALDESDLRDGFRSFPSGHCSMSFAGLTYLAIFLSEFVFALPLAHLSTKSSTSTPISAPIVGTEEEDYTHAARVENSETPLPRFPIMVIILICGIPILLAMYIASTRFSDYRHHTFDILAGSALGIFAGVVGWRWYGAWCCAGGEGRVYALKEHLASRGTMVEEEDVETGKGVQRDPGEGMVDEGVSREERRRERRERRQQQGVAV